MTQFCYWTQWKSRSRRERFPRTHTQRLALSREETIKMYHVLQPIPKEFNCVVQLERKEIPQPTKIKKRPKMENTRKPVATNSDLPKLSAFEEKRLQNLRDNKEMLAKLLDDLKDELGGSAFTTKGRGRPKGPPKVAKERKPLEPVRRNPSRRSREGGTSEESSGGLALGFDFMRRSPFIESDDSDEENNRDIIRKRPKRSYGSHMKTIDRDTRGPDEITEEELEMVAEHSSNKKYDQVHGKSCHQCRQKTIDTKTICRGPECWGVRGQFCGPCLRNRYGEDVREALKDPNWECPPCRGICNCSFCRARAGKACTGILIHLARDHGYNDVNSFLQSFRKK